MKVFLSYASEDRPVAELVAGSIEARGHHVFFDRFDLPPGDTYEDQIQTAIEEANVLVFLITPVSVSAGRFTLTELAFARQRWRSAKRHVLPVMARPTDLDHVPPYLKAVTILEPDGNLPAEVAAAVDRMAWAMRRVLGRAAVSVATLTAIVAGAYYLVPPRPAFEVSVMQATAKQQGYFDEEDSFEIIYSARNTGGAGDEVTEATLEVEPPGALRSLPGNKAVPNTVAPGSVLKGAIEVSAASPTARYRVCLHAMQVSSTCSAWADWQAPSGFPYRDKLAIEPSLSRNATAVGTAGTAYLVGARSPNRLVLVDTHGQVLAEAKDIGEPVTISDGTVGLFVGTTAPNEILELDARTLAIRTRMPVKLSAALDRKGSPISVQPASLAQDGTRLWVLTRGGTSTAGIGWLDMETGEVITPPYYEDVAFDLTDMRLRSGDGAVWSGQDSTTPASITRLRTDGMLTYGGHDYDIASCASDVLPIATDTLLVPDCNGIVRRVIARDTLVVNERVGSLNNYNPVRDSWERVRLDAAGPDKFVGALSVRVSAPFETPEVNDVTVSTLSWAPGPGLIFSLTGARIVDFVAGPGAPLMIIENAEKQRQLVSPGYN